MPRLSFAEIAGEADETHDALREDRYRPCISCNTISTPVSSAPMTSTAKNRIMIFGPKDDGTYVVEFRTADGEA
jgi:hypothetical protein